MRWVEPTAVEHVYVLPTPAAVRQSTSADGPNFPTGAILDHFKTFQKVLSPPPSAALTIEIERINSCARRGKDRPQEIGESS